MINKEQVVSILNRYQDAWEKQDVDILTDIFCENGIYHENAFEAPYIGLDEIRGYWISKVVKQQENIRFKLLNMYLEGAVAIAEWEAWFFDKEEKKNQHIKEVAIIEFKDNKIYSLREYWASE